MIECKSSKGSAANKSIIHVTKLYSSRDGNSFDAFGRTYTGTCQAGQGVHVLGEGYVPDENDEDMAVATIEAVAIPRSPIKIEVTLATAGNECTYWERVTFPTTMRIWRWRPSKLWRLQGVQVRSK
jgi:translation elongation factor EF-G